MVSLLLLHSLHLSSYGPDIQSNKSHLLSCRLVWDEVQTAAELCTCVYKKDLQLLQSYLQAGAKLDSGDYDKRTALHIAASEGNIEMVSGRATWIHSAKQCVEETAASNTENLCPSGRLKGEGQNIL